MAEESEGIVEQIEEVYRIGKYDASKTRPMKIRFKTQTAAEHVIDRTWKLAKVVNMKNLWIRKDMSEEERNKAKELITEAKTKNDARTQDEMTKSFWKVVDLKIRKWWLKDTAKAC